MNRYEPVIKKENLLHGAYYRGRCRNAEYARWNAETNRFYHWRTKFGHTFIEEIECPEDEQQFDVFVAEELIDIFDLSNYKEIPFNTPVA